MALLDTLSEALSSGRSGDTVRVRGRTFTKTAEGQWIDEYGTPVDLSDTQRNTYGARSSVRRLQGLSRLMDVTDGGTPATATDTPRVAGGPLPRPESTGMTASEMLARGITLPGTPLDVEMYYPFRTDPGFARRNLAESLGFRTSSPSWFTRQLLQQMDLLSRLVDAQRVVAGGGEEDTTADMVQRLSAALGAGRGLSSSGLLRQIGELQQRRQRGEGLATGQETFLESLEPTSPENLKNMQKLFEASQYSRTSPYARGSLDDVFQSMYDEYRRGQHEDPNRTFFGYLGSRFS